MRIPRYLLEGALDAELDRAELVLARADRKDSTLLVYDTSNEAVGPEMLLAGCQPAAMAGRGAARRLSALGKCAERLKAAQQLLEGRQAAGLSVSAGETREALVAMETAVVELRRYSGVLKLTDGDDVGRGVLCGSAEVVARLFGVKVNSLDQQTTGASTTPPLITNPEERQLLAYPVLRLLGDVYDYVRPRCHILTTLASDGKQGSSLKSALLQTEQLLIRCIDHIVDNEVVDVHFMLSVANELDLPIWAATGKFFQGKAPTHAVNATRLFWTTCWDYRLARSHRFIYTSIVQKTAIVLMRSMLRLVPSRQRQEMIVVDAMYLCRHLLECLPEAFPSGRNGEGRVGPVEGFGDTVALFLLAALMRTAPLSSVAEFISADAPETNPGANDDELEWVKSVMEEWLPLERGSVPRRTDIDVTRHAPLEQSVPHANVVSYTTNLDQLLKHFFVAVAPRISYLGTRVASGLKTGEGNHRQEKGSESRLAQLELFLAECSRSPFVVAPCPTTQLSGRTDDTPRVVSNDTPRVVSNDSPRVVSNDSLPSLLILAAGARSRHTYVLHEVKKYVSRRWEVREESSVALPEEQRKERPFSEIQSSTIEYYKHAESKEAPKEAAAEKAEEVEDHSEAVEARRNLVALEAVSRWCAS